MMKKITHLLAFTAFILFANFAQAQTPTACDGKRYVQDVFADTTMSNLRYGTALGFGGTPINLEMTVVQPKGDGLSKRPLIIFAFGGGFVQGKRSDMIAFCQAFAKKGFVTATIDYRLYNFLLLGLPDSTKITPTIVQANQDMRAAVRYFYKDAATANLFRVDTSNIIIGGVSAGAITALTAAQLDATDPIAPWVQTIINAEGGIEGKSGNPGYSSKVKGVINMSGALYQKEWLDQGDVPFISFHGTIDKTVPYGRNKNVYSFYSEGSGLLYPYARQLGIPSVLVSVAGGDHSDIYANTGKFAPQYADFVAKSFVFTKQLVCNESIASSTTAVDDLNHRQIKLYPNPSSDDMTLELGDNAEGGYQVSIYDLTGREVYRSAMQDSPICTLEKSNIGQGMFITRVVFERKQSVLVRKVIFE